MVVVVVQHGPPAVGYLLRVNAGRPTRTASASCRERNNHPVPHSGLLRATKPLFLLTHCCGSDWEVAHGEKKNVKGRVVRKSVKWWPVEFLETAVTSSFGFAGCSTLQPQVGQWKWPQVIHWNFFIFSKDIILPHSLSYEHKMYLIILSPVSRSIEKQARKFSALPHFASLPSRPPG